MSFSKLQEFQMKLGWNEEKYTDTNIPNVIYHYTSSQGMESILFSNKDNTELWASRYDCLNDISEGKVAQEVYLKVCQKMLANNELTEDFYNLIIDIKPPKTKLMWHKEDNLDTDILARPEYVRYICSFSKNSDSLAMWNYYTKDSRYEGFNLGFYSKLFIDSVDLHLQKYETAIGLYPVVYEKEKQEEVIYRFINDIRRVYKPGEETGLRYIISNQLLDWSLTFKKEFFKHEEEVRLIVYVGKRNSSIGIPQIDINYRMTKGYTVPYIKLQFEKDCLSDVTIGPLNCDVINKNLQVEVLEERLNAEEYLAIGHYSEIPVRY